MDIRLPQEGIELTITLRSLETSLINQALARTNGNKAYAAKLLGLNRTTLIEKMRKYGMKLQLPSGSRGNA